MAGGLVAAAMLLGAPAAASAAVESAQLGGTAAQFSYDSGGAGFSNLQLTIIRNGTTLVSQSPDPSPLTGTLQGVGPAYGGQGPSVRVLRLDSATTEPAVVFDLFTGGAHCCFYSQIFVFNPGAGTYSSFTHDWLDQGYTFKDLDGDGIPEFSSVDGNFAYAFGSFAASRYPPQIWRLSGVQLLDVTRQFPDLIRADIRRQKRGLKGVAAKFDLRPPLTALTADECLLGSCSKGFKIVAATIKRGGKILGKPGAFPAKLRKFLRKTGYL
jgi:hypothetical protein